MDLQNQKKSAPVRKSVRISTGNYHEPGLYFLTCCSFGNALLFGKIQDNDLALNPVGEMISRWWEKLPAKFCRIELRDFIVMPNHFHGIIIINSEEPRQNTGREDIGREDTGREEPRQNTGQEDIGREDTGREEPRQNTGREEPWLLPYESSQKGKMGIDPRVDPSVPRIMQWVKTMSTNEFLRLQKESGQTGSPKLWQRSYYDHIIRNDADYKRISEYIKNNPGKWIADRFHQGPADPRVRAFTSRGPS